MVLLLLLDSVYIRTIECFKFTKKTPQITKKLTQKGWSLFHIGCRRVVGRLRQSSASLHPLSGTSFLRVPLARQRPTMLCRSLPATTRLTLLPVFQQQVGLQRSFKDIGEPPIIFRESPTSFEESQKIFDATSKSLKYLHVVHRMFTNQLSSLW